LKSQDQISNKYRTQVDELLDSQSSQGLYKPLSQKELDEIWEEISMEIDMDEVWNEISSDLDIVMPVDTSSGIFIKTVSAVLIILIGMIPVKKIILDSNYDQPDKFIEINQNEQPTGWPDKNKSGIISPSEKTKSDISPALMRSANNENNGNKAILTERDRTGLSHEKTITVSNMLVISDLSTHLTEDSNPALFTDHIPAGQSLILPVTVPEDDLKRISVSSKIDINKPVINTNYPAAGHSVPSAGRRNISVGLITVLKNTWLLNNETFEGLKSESLNTSEIVFFPDIGLSLNYSLNKTWQIQADGFFFSNTGQDYLEYYYGQYSRKNIILRYSTIAPSVKYKFNGRSHFMSRSSINILVGGYFSVLNYANMKINSDLQRIGSQYRQCDFGVRIGSEIELHLFDHLSLAPGLFLSLGIPNIYKGTGNIPGYLRSTQNGSAEFHIAFYYHFE
jgi:hypothetical protein